MQIDLVSKSDLSQYYIPFFWGVSFFTFQQITYLIQSYENKSQKIGSGISELYYIFSIYSFRSYN